MYKKLEKLKNKYILDYWIAKSCPFYVWKELLYDYGTNLIKQLNLHICSKYIIKYNLE